MNSILQHGRDFKEFHRGNQGKISRLSKAILSHHATLEREQRKKQELLEKERIRRLMVRGEGGRMGMVEGVGKGGGKGGMVRG